MKHVVHRFVETLQAVVRLLGLTALGTFVLTALVALRHSLETPQALKSQLPGETHLYRWKHGHISYQVQGKPGMPSLLLLHTPGLAASAYEMHGIMEPLAAHYRIYAPDLLGFGLSDRPDIDYSAEMYTQLCRDFLSQVVARPAIIVASRLSCNYAVAVAATSPDLCNGLVLISPVALHEDLAAETRLVRVLSPALLESGPVKALIYPLLVEIKRLMLRAGQQEQVPAVYYYATTHQFGAAHAPMAWLAGKLVENVSHQVEKAQQPTLIIWGAEALEHTRFVNNRSDTSWGGPPHTQIALLQNAGLDVHEKHPRVVVKTLLQWSNALQEPQTKAVSTTTRAATAEQSASVGAEASLAERASTPSRPTPIDRPEVVQPAVEAYCMKCKKKTAMLDAREITMKNGRIAVQGVCSVCGAPLFRMGRLPPGYPQTPV